MKKLGYQVLDNGQIMIIKEVVTGIQIATVEMPIGMEKRLFSESAKNNIALNESLIIRFRWQKFNLEAGSYEDDYDSNDIIKIDVAGTKDELQPVNGTESITFSSAEPGTYTIRTENTGVDNAFLEVTVNA